MKKNPVPLSELPPGSTCTVHSLSCPRGLARRLMEMGLLPGTRVSVTRVAPLGDPVQLHVRDYALSIRRAEARAIEVTDARLPAPSLVRIPSTPAG